MANPSDTRLAALDFLRGIAISMVILCHGAIFFLPSKSYERIFGFGAQGVQLFFIVSAITMCYMWDKRKNESFETMKFYVRRVLRIAPIFWFAIIFYCTIKILNGNALPNLRQTLTSIFLVNGFSPFTNNAIVPGGWSIAVEIFFYLIFPLVVRFSRNNRMCLIWAIVVFVLVDVLLAQFFKDHVFSSSSLYAKVDWNEYIYQSVLTQLPVFFFGILVYRIALLHDRKGLLFCAMAFVIWLIVAFGLRKYGYYGRPFFWILCAGFSVLAIWALHTQFSNRVLVFLGRMSYSLYIFHFSVIDLFHHYVPMSMRGSMPTFIGWVAAIFVCSVIVAELSRRTLESWSSQLSRWTISQVSQRLSTTA